MSRLRSRFAGRSRALAAGKLDGLILHPVIAAPLDVERLYREHGPHVYAFAFRMLGERESALDVVQETFAVALANASAFRGEASPLTWLTGIARNLCLKRVGRTRERTFEDFEGVIEAHGRPPAGLASDTERRFYEAEVKEGCLIGLLQCLPVNQRCVFVLHILHDLPVAAIASIMGRSPNAVRILLSRARASMRAFLCANCALLGGTTCACSNMIEFSLDRNLIGRYRPDADHVADELARLADEIELYRSLPDPSAAIASVLQAGRFALFRPK